MVRWYEQILLNLTLIIFNQVKHNNWTFFEKFPKQIIMMQKYREYFQSKILAFQRIVDLVVCDKLSQLCKNFNENVANYHNVIQKVSHLKQIQFILSLPFMYHTGYIEGICGQNTGTTFDIKWVIGAYGNWKNQSPGGRFGAAS